MAELKEQHETMRRGYESDAQYRKKGTSIQHRRDTPLAIENERRNIYIFREQPKYYCKDAKYCSPKRERPLSRHGKKKAPRTA